MNLRSGTQWIGIVLICSLSGCGGKMKVAPVSGTITLDGQPLERASVLFLPDKGRPSFSVTDNKGYYTLIYSMHNNGAEIGPCTVKITTKLPPAGTDDDDAKPAPEKVPTRYAKEPVKVTVEPKKNKIDIALTSNP